jgi:uncharacterized protein YjbJ (UPF0337 family)
MKIANFLRNVFGKIKETQGSLILNFFSINKKNPHKASLISKFYFMKIANFLRNVFGKIKETQGSLIPRIFKFSKKKNPTKLS